MSSEHKQKIHRLLKGIETGDPASVTVVNEERYIQHNPQTHEGSEGLAKLFERLSRTSPRVNVARIFADGDFVFAHTEYDFSTRNIGFEIFRFEDGFAVEHWDNIQKRRGPNVSGHSMVDGVTEVCDFEKTGSNREAIRSFLETILIGQQSSDVDAYVNRRSYIEHSPDFGDDLSGLVEAVSGGKASDQLLIEYKTCHRILAEGNFVLAVSEGYRNAMHSSFFDLFRLENNKIVEHWDTTEAIPPRGEWKNNNGKF